ncbi:hypothetical protein FOH38_23165 [Lysinibacillus fusiformis]|nr:hypothetical protein FOH38_23165 [Lysinibacillus fusiformis]
MAIRIKIFIFLLGLKKSSSIPISQPEGKVVVDSEYYTMMPGDYQWKEDNIEIKTISSLDINKLADDFETLAVEKRKTLKFEIEKNPLSLTLTKLNEDGTSDNVEIKDNKIIMPSEEGYYIYELKATWAEGKETFVFDVYVE